MNCSRVATESRRNQPNPVILSILNDFRLYRKIFYSISCFFHVDKIKILGIRIDMKEIREVVLCIKALSVQILSICLKANYATHLPATPAQ